MSDFNPAEPEPTTALQTHEQPRTPQVRTIAPNVEQVDFSDESVSKYEFEKYNGTANVTDRIYIPNAKGVIKARTHYVDRGTTKFMLVCRSQYVRRSDGSGEDLVHEAQCCKLLGSSTPRFAVLIIHYATTKTGQPTKPFTMFRKLWKFGSDKYIQIRNISRDFPLDQHDLSIYCPADGEQFQKLQILAKPDCYVMHPKFSETERQNIQNWAQANLNKLPRELGRTYANDGEMLRDLQQAGVLTAAGPVPTMASDQPVANFEDIIQTTAVVK